MVGVTSIPQWLQILLEENFFRPCIVHHSAKKNEKNSFCLDCCTSICLHCLPTHQPHRLLQIRRYVYHDVIRLCDAQKLMNCSLVQPYTTNSAKVIFLHKRPMTSRPFKSSGNFCMKCDRSLQDSYLFCCLSCKINHHQVTSKSGVNKQISKTLLSFFDKDRNSVSYPELGGNQMTPDLILDDLPVVSERTWYGSTSGSIDSLACSATIECVKKKKRSTLLVPRSSCQQRCSTVNRRKRVPHRAPLN